MAGFVLAFGLDVAFRLAEGDALFRAADALATGEGELAGLGLGLTSTAASGDGEGPILALYFPRSHTR